MTTTNYDTLDLWIDKHFDEEVRFLQELVRVPTDTPPGNNAPHAERTAELLAAMGLPAEKHPVPAGWRMSPRSVLTYICGGKCSKLDITPKYIGHQRLVEIAISPVPSAHFDLLNRRCHPPGQVLEVAHDQPAILDADNVGDIGERQPQHFLDDAVAAHQLGAEPIGHEFLDVGDHVRFRSQDAPL